MSTQNRNDPGAAQPGDRPAAKKPYQKPAFGHGRVFETRTLAGGKVQATQQQLNSNRRTSWR
jgi:hypothetical protein